jgi:hypothetical protein
MDNDAGCDRPDGGMEAVMGRRLFWFALVGSWVAVVAHAQAGTPVWADGLFSEKAHDFGPVPRGAKVRHNFVLSNQTTDTLTILDLRASCGCTAGRASTTTVPPGKSAVIEAEMDTRNFVGRKATTLTVSLVSARGKDAEVRLALSSTILSDIVLNPGSIDFGAVSKGQSPELTLTIDRLGGPNWKAERMVSTSKAVTASLFETSRSEKGVGYLLKASLRPDAPSGQVRDEIRILTNDPETPSIAVLVTAVIRGELTASPTTLALGNVVSSGEAQGRYLIQGRQPFAVTSVEGNGEGFHLSADDTGKKPLHVLTLSFRREEGTARGDLKRTFRIRTDLTGEPPVEVEATLRADP